MTSPIMEDLDSHTTVYQLSLGSRGLSKRILY